jgi:hypothetical protein
VATLSNSTFFKISKGTTPDALRRSPECRFRNIHNANLAKSKRKKSNSGNYETSNKTFHNNGLSNSFAIQAIKHSKVIVTLISLINSNAKFTKPHITYSTINGRVFATEAANV